jgi:hydroxymethylbilane synthase|tara:strand:- start:526 stop:1389 length:864 start_codon:yes stop_codon:yes gene_type:complete
MTLKIATRSSKLALAQVDEFVSEYNISDYKIIKIKTEGDVKSSKGDTLFDKAHFVTDIQKSILRGDADIAVHSAKDTPAKKTNGIERNFIISRTSKDVLVFKDNNNNFNSSMKLGTSSLRRKLQAFHFLKSTNVFDINGNVDTRLEKLYQGEYDCIILAKAGLERLRLLEELNYKEMNWITASGQGTLAVEMIESFNENEELLEIHSNIKKKLATNSIEYERNILDKVDAGCNSAIAMESISENSKQIIRGEIYGVKKFITFSGATDIEAIQDIERQNGRRFLNEHN